MPVVEATRDQVQRSGWNTDSSSCLSQAGYARTVAAGDNSLSAATAMTYDALGNLLTVDGPLSGTADTTRYRYNGSSKRVSPKIRSSASKLRVI